MTLTTRAPDLAALEPAIDSIWRIAADFGLEPFPTHFEIVPASIMYEIGSYGMPGRFTHWTHGKSYHLQKSMYDFGMSKIYELVINTDPCWAFLLESNSLLENQFVVAHVLGHSDFFRNNAYFQKTSRRMLDTIKLNVDRIRDYEYQYGVKAVEETLDAVLSIQEHVAPWEQCDLGEGSGPSRDRAGSYDDLWVLDQTGSEQAAEPVQVSGQRCRTPQHDLLLFLAVESPALEDWQRDIVQIVRSEMLYFYPQMQTKIINEGWASYWHVQIMRALDLPMDDHVEFAKLHSGVVQSHPHRLNPYFLGFSMLNDIERRFDAIDGEGAGRDRLFQVRETECDVSLVRNYLTQELVENLDLYFAERQGDELVVTEKDWESVRDRLVDQLVDFGIPTITAEDADYRGNRELYLRHHWTGQPLDARWAKKALEGVQTLWGRAVWLETQRDDKLVRLRYHPFDGHTTEDAD
ncbi:SpoVR family protein [soil metagenome]